ncbi:MAG: hypothetical protein E6G92_04230 [Alphaproteobacteria bacterium]|nr:MAG: hypothetical protein E6G92_04230 [Alphaproteobacteria bacterium]
MSTVFFSPSTGGFYTAELHGEAMPADVVRISAARHARLLEDQAAGAEIGAGSNGAPIARFPKVTLAAARSAAVGAVKRQARARILAIAPYWRQLNDAAAIAEAAYYGDAGSREAQRALERQRAIGNIRGASDQVEARISAMSADELAGFDPGDDSHWSADA